jgi:carboxylesterase type B
MTGSSSVMGPDYLMDEDIVLVTVNYRLNVFGECLYSKESNIFHNSCFKWLIIDFCFMKGF